MKTGVLWLFIAAVAWTSAPAGADIVLSFAYETLSSSYTPLTATTGQFRATHTTDLDGSAATPVDYSKGTVTRLADPTGYARFDWDPAYNDFYAAKVQLTLNLTNIDRLHNTASASGLLELSDVDDDMIIGTVSGRWSLGAGGQAVFNGAISGLVFQPPTATFDGNPGLRSPGFSMDFTRFDQPLGTFLDVTDLAGGFFENSFTRRSSGVVSQVIPAPGAALLGAIGLALAEGLRRRLAGSRPR
ncbi:MAG: hypothetical protein HY718_05390 [Planctomycetes bacterium]|nr:hypothetical protein [Planctomycetota bacterium]